MSIASNALKKFIQIIVIMLFNLNDSNYVSFSPWDWGQIGINLGTKHVVYKRLASFRKHKDVYVNRLESAFLGM